MFLGAVWGAVFLFMRIAAPEVGAVWAAEIRVTLAALILVVVAGRRTWRTARGRVLDFLVTGATFSAIPFTLIAFATLTLPVGVGALLNAATPLFTAMIGVAVLGQRLTGRVVAGIAIGMGAVALVVGWSPLDLGPGHAARRRGRARRRAQLRGRGHLRPPPPERDPGHRDRDRPARVGLDRPAPVRRPVRPARRAVRRRGRVAARGGRRVDGARLAAVLPGAQADVRDGGQHRDLHRPGVRDPVGGDRRWASPSGPSSSSGSR